MAPFSNGIDNVAVNGVIAASLGEIVVMVSRFEKRPDEVGESAKNLIAVSNRLAALHEPKPAKGRG